MSYDDFHTSSPIKSVRKAHQCEQCGRNILVGEPAVKGCGKFDGNFYSTYQHPECQEAGLAYAELTGCYGEHAAWFQHDDLEREDKLWLLDNHPIVAARLRLSRAELVDEEYEHEDAA